VARKRSSAEMLLSDQAEHQIWDDRHLNRLLKIHSDVDRPQTSESHFTDSIDDNDKPLAEPLPPSYHLRDYGRMTILSRDSLSRRPFDHRPRSTPWPR